MQEPTESETPTAQAGASGAARKAILITCAACLLLAAAGWYQLRGFRQLVLSDAIRPGIGPPIDLYFRWTELRYVWQGQNPNDIYFLNQPQGEITPPRPITRSVTIDPELGGISRAPYPPWANVSGALLWWPDWPATRLWFALVNVASLGLIAWWAWSTGRPQGRAPALLLLAASMACAHYWTILHLGQVTIVVVATIVAALLLAERDKQFASGLCLAVAMLKPTVSGPFFIAYLVKRQWKAAAACAGAVAISSGIVWGLTKTDPLEWFLQMVTIGEVIEIYSTDSPILILTEWGVDGKTATRGLAVGLLAICTFAMWCFRERPLAELFAIAAVTAHLWTHHKTYDEVVLLLVVVPLGSLAFQSHRGKAMLLLFGLLGLSIWHLSLIDLISPRLHLVLQAILAVKAVIAILAARQNETHAEAVA